MKQVGYFSIIVKTISKKNLENPWISYVILKRMSIRDKLYKFSVRKMITRKINTDIFSKLNKKNS